MLSYFKNLWKELGRSIFTGERYKANLRGLAFGSALIIILSVVTGYMNLNKGFIREASIAILGIISGAKDTYIKEGFTDYLSKSVMFHELEDILVKNQSCEGISSCEEL